MALLTYVVVEQCCRFLFLVIMCMASLSVGIFNLLIQASSEVCNPVSHLSITYIMMHLDVTHDRHSAGAHADDIARSFGTKQNQWLELILENDA